MVVSDPFIYHTSFIADRRAAARKIEAKTPLPDIRNPTEMQAFFVQEVQLGEELLGDGSKF